MTSQPPQTKAIAVHVRVRPATEKDGPSKEDALAMDPIGGNISAVNATGDRRTTFECVLRAACCVLFAACCQLYAAVCGGREYVIAVIGIWSIWRA